MKRLSNVVLLGSGVLILAMTANAQTWRQDSYDSPRNHAYYGDGRDGYGQYGYSRQGYDARQNPEFLIGRVLSDLNRAAASAYLDGHERRHFDEVANKLQEFETRWAQGRFDTGKLDKAIENLEHLAGADRVRGRDRAMFARDLRDLREFRATRGGYYPQPGSYRNWR